MLLFVGQQLILILCTVVLSERWLLTSVCILFSLVTTMLSLIFNLDYYLGFIIPQICIQQVVYTYIAYFCEKRTKYEFIQLRENSLMKDELRYMLESVPEAILIYSPLTKEVLMMNTELTRILDKYSERVAVARESLF
jgi:uncharacterized protein YqgQ